MGVGTITNHLVHPTENDVNGGVVGQGIAYLETSMVALFRSLGALRNFVISGFNNLGGSGLNRSVAGGEAVINGYLVKGTSGSNVTFDASTTNRLWLQLVMSGGKAVGVQLLTTTSDTVPANAVRLADVVTSGSDVTSITDKRPQNRRSCGSVGNAAAILERGSDDWTVTNQGTYREITFQTAFFRAPVVTITQHSTQLRAAPGYQIVSASVIRVYTFAVDDFVDPATDVTAAFSFTAEL